MSKTPRDDLDRQLASFADRLPNSMARLANWMRQPSSRWVRIPAAIALICGGIVGFLPVLGFWMIPLGLALIALDVPFLRSPLSRLLAWIERRWPADQSAS
jgi:hypothetical protein